MRLAVRIDADGNFLRPLTDRWNGERLAQQFGDQLRYERASGRWWRWTGTRWEPDGTGFIERCAKAVAASIYDEGLRAAGVGEKADYLAHGIKSESARGLRAMVELAKSEPGLAVGPEEFDTDPWLLNTLSGTVDLRTGACTPHRREDLLTRLCPVEFLADAPAPRWEAFLARIFEGDRALVEYVQRAVGYSLTASTRAQVFFVLWGVGANGKSTLLNALAGLLGDYSAQVPGDTLLRRRPGAPTNDLAALRGVRLARATETDRDIRLNEALVKQLTGGDAIVGRRLYSEYEEFTPVAKFWLATNHKPALSAGDSALWRRVQLVPFAVTIPEAERDDQLNEKLLAEFPGILAWAVRGAVAWNEQGLNPPAAVLGATRAYQVEADAIARFVSEATVQDPNGRAPASQILDSYRLWCDANGERALGVKAFKTEMLRLGFPSGRSAGGVLYRGLALLSEEGDRVTPESQACRDVGSCTQND